MQDLTPKMQTAPESVETVFGPPAETPAPEPTDEPSSEDPEPSPDETPSRV